MLGVKNQMVHIWVTPLEIQELEQGPVKGIIHLSDRESSPLEVSLLTEGPELAAEIEAEERKYCVRMSRLYYEQLKERGKTMLMVLNDNGMEMVNVYDARIHAEQFKNKLER